MLRISRTRFILAVVAGFVCGFFTARSWSLPNHGWHGRHMAVILLFSMALAIPLARLQRWWLRRKETTGSTPVAPAVVKISRIRYGILAVLLFASGALTEHLYHPRWFVSAVAGTCGILAIVSLVEGFRSKATA